MSAAGRSDASAPAESLAAACRVADFVRLTATADGDALAALGQLGAALRATDVPFHASVARVPNATTNSTAPEADCTVAFGAEGADVALTDGPLSATAYTAARELGVDPDPLLAMAGAVAAGFTPGGDTPFYSEAEPLVTRQPGVATPVADPADGVAHTTLVHADVSGDPDAVRDALAAPSLSEASDDE
ncbi:exonuclease RecJ, partial [Halobacteriales archaeon QS_9_67_17]